MVCPKCNSENVTITMEQVSSKTTKKSKRFRSRINNSFRRSFAICTFGLSNLFWRKSGGTEDTKFKTKKFCVCQNCGYSWKLKK